MNSFKSLKNNLILFLLFGSLISCNAPDRLDVDVSEITVDLDLYRIDKALFSAAYDSLDNVVADLLTQHPDFMELYGEKIIEVGAVNTADFSVGVKAFYNYTVAGGIDTKVAETFADAQSLKEELKDAFAHYKYHFPGIKIPKVYAYISGVRQSVFIADGMLGISLDKYLGENSEIYSRMQVDRYKRKKMYKEKIVADCMQALAVGNYAFNDSVNNLLSNMVYQGKLLYFIDAMLPEAPDSVKIGYTAKGIRWAEHNERDVWDYLIAKKLLFSTDEMEIRKFVGEGPFTIPFTNNSPPQIAVWTGWQIVRSYMNNHPEVTLRELMENDDYQQILRYSRYRP